MDDKDDEAAVHTQSPDWGDMQHMADNVAVAGDTLVLVQLLVLVGPAPTPPGALALALAIVGALDPALVPVHRNAYHLHL